MNTKFQQRHYEAIAEVLRQCKRYGYDTEEELIKLFKSDNFKFSESRFRSAVNPKHYHVLNGLTGGYMPDNNTMYENLYDAQQDLKQLVSMARDNEEKITGSIKSGYFCTTNGNYCYEISECDNMECLKAQDKEEGITV